MEFIQLNVRYRSMAKENQALLGSFASKTAWFVLKYLYWKNTHK